MLHPVTISGIQSELPETSSDTVNVLQSRKTRFLKWYWFLAPPCAGISIFRFWSRKSAVWVREPKSILSNQLGYQYEVVCINIGGERLYQHVPISEPLRGPIKKNRRYISSPTPWSVNRSRLSYIYIYIIIFFISIYILMQKPLSEIYLKMYLFHGCYAFSQLVWMNSLFEKFKKLFYPRKSVWVIKK